MIPSAALKPTVIHPCNISKYYTGVFGPMENVQPYHPTPALDIAILPLLEDLKIGEEIMPFFIHDSKHVELKTYTGPSEDMRGKQVQQEGGKSSLVHGEIIQTNFDMYVQGRWLGEDGFQVASNEMIFAAQGDSGSVIIDDLRSCSGCDSPEAYAYGVLLLVETNCRRISPQSNEPYKAIAWCTRLNHGFDVLRSKAGLELDFITLKDVVLKDL